MRLYIIRHADPDYEHGTITPFGHEEAAALAQRLATEGIDRIYSSSMGRALHTMEYTAKLLDKQPVILDWIREIEHEPVEFADQGKMAAWDAPGEMIFEHKLHFDGDNWIPFRHLEVIREKVERIRNESDRFLAGLGYERMGGRYSIRAPNRLKIALFCHGGFGLSWLSHLLQIPPILVWTGFWLPPSSVSTILFEERSAEWAVPRCLGLGDVSHLYAAGLTVRPRGLYGNLV